MEDDPYTLDQSEARVFAIQVLTTAVLLALGLIVFFDSSLFLSISAAFVYICATTLSEILLVVYHRTHKES